MTSSRPPSALTLVEERRRWTLLAPRLAGPADGISLSLVFVAVASLAVAGIALVCFSLAWSVPLVPLLAVAAAAFGYQGVSRWLGRDRLTLDAPGAVDEDAYRGPGRVRPLTLSVTRQGLRSRHGTRLAASAVVNVFVIPGTEDGCHVVARIAGRPGVRLLHDLPRRDAEAAVVELRRILDLPSPW